MLTLEDGKCANFFIGPKLVERRAQGKSLASCLIRKITVPRGVVLHCMHCMTAERGHPEPTSQDRGLLWLFDRSRLQCFWLNSVCFCGTDASLRSPEAQKEALRMRACDWNFQWINGRSMGSVRAGSNVDAEEAFFRCEACLSQATVYQTGDPSGRRPFCMRQKTACLQRPACRNTQCCHAVWRPNPNSIHTCCANTLHLGQGCLPWVARKFGLKRQLREIGLVQMICPCKLLKEAECPG